MQVIPSACTCTFRYSSDLVCLPQARSDLPLKALLHILAPAQLLETSERALQCCLCLHGQLITGILMQMSNSGEQSNAISVRTWAWPAQG